MLLTLLSKLTFGCRLDNLSVLLHLWTALGHCLYKNEKTARWKLPHKNRLLGNSGKCSKKTRKRKMFRQYTKMSLWPNSFVGRTGWLVSSILLTEIIVWMVDGGCFWIQANGQAVRTKADRKPLIFLYIISFLIFLAFQNLKVFCCSRWKRASFQLFFFCVFDNRIFLAFLSFSNTNTWGCFIWFF